MTESSAFRIVARPRAWWPVTWDGVTEDGDIVTNRIELRFWRMKQPEYIEALQASDDVRDEMMKAAAAGEVQRVPQIQAAYVSRIACDWRGVELENGEMLKWSDENLTMLMHETGLFDRVLTAFQACNLASKEAREGN